MLMYGRVSSRVDWSAAGCEPAVAVEDLAGSERDFDAISVRRARSPAGTGGGLAAAAGRQAGIVMGVGHLGFCPGRPVARYPLIALALGAGWLWAAVRGVLAAAVA